MEKIKFQENVPGITYVLNLIIQDILKALIKNDYDTSYSKDIYKTELNENKKKDYRTRHK
jgi:hypothetical protein